MCCWETESFLIKVLGDIKVCKTAHNRDLNYKLLIREYCQMKILITSPSLDTKYNVGGISNLTRLLLKYSSDINYRLFVAGKKDSETRNIKWFFRQFSVLYSFYKEAKQVHDLVHINMPFEQAGIIRDYMFTLTCRFVRKPYLIHIRGGIYMGNPHTPKFFRYLIKKTLNKAKRIIVLGNKEKEFIASFYKIQTPITALPNAVQVPAFNPKVLNEHKTTNILFLGRLDKNKGLVEIIEALSALSANINYCFHIAGEGPDKAWFLDACEQKLNGNFQYHGVIAGEDKNALLAKSHIFLLPSYYEGLPNALLEAMAYGCVPIVTPVGSIPEVVSHNFNGLIISLKNSMELESAIVSLLENPVLYKNFSEQAYITIKERYALSNYIQKLNQVYSEII